MAVLRVGFRWVYGGFGYGSGVFLFGGFLFAYADLGVNGVLVPPLHILDP